MQTPLLFPLTSSQQLDDYAKMNYDCCSNDMIAFDLQRQRSQINRPQLLFHSVLVPTQHTSTARVIGCQCRAASVLQHL